MPIDFDWQEGSHPFRAEGVQVQPPPASAPPSLAPASFPAALPHPRPRLSNLALLALGIALGIAAGFAILTYEGQRNARADVAPVIELEQKALAEGDADLYRRLLDDGDPDRQRAILAAQAQTALLAGPAPLKVGRVTLQGDVAEADVSFQYDDRTFHRLESLRLSGDQWRLAPVQVGDWGPVATTTGDNVTLHYRQRDAFLADLAPQMDAIAAAFCRRYSAPTPCRLDISIEPAPDLMPFRPGQGDPSPLALTRYEGPRDPNKAIVLFNRQADGSGDGANLRALARSLGVRSVERLQVTEQVASTSTLGADGALTMRFISPRLVGWSGKTPHPLWWLGLTEAMGETILRRSLGPITGSDQDVYTLWTAARGDVAVWAERLSGVRAPTDEAPLVDADPVLVGAALAAGDPTPRAAARSFALYLHASVGEKDLLSMLAKARQAAVIQDASAIFGKAPADLVAGWRQWQEAQRLATTGDISPGPAAE